MLDLSAAHDTLRDSLRGWYLARRRRLPWRETPTPYRVWISEIMLQQTQVSTVLPYFERFIAAFPDVRALALAPIDDVLTLWSGLGYYRRARHLHKAAGVVLDRFGGALPSDLQALRSLPGIGRYTAGAIASIAFGQPEALLDGNVSRVLARLVALDEPTNTSAGTRALWSLAEALVDPRDPSSHNQALMELGALVCTPRSPTCETCPLAPQCRALSRGQVATYPIKRRRARARAVSAVCGVAYNEGGSLLIARRPDDALLGGLWELPGGDLSDDPQKSQKESLTHLLRERLSLMVEVGPHRATIKHIFSHRHLTLDVYEMTVPLEATPQLSWYSSWRWLDPRAGADLPLSRLTEKVLDATGVTR